RSCAPRAAGTSGTSFRMVRDRRECATASTRPRFGSTRSDQRATRASARCRQLTAGRGYVAPAGQAHGCRNALAVEHSLERVDRLAGRALEPSGRVVRDEVDLEYTGVENRGELGRLLHSVVHPAKHHVLDEHLATAQLEVAPALGEHV